MPPLKDWLDALLFLVIYFLLLALCDPVPAAEIHHGAAHKEEIMQLHSHGPLHATPVPGCNGYTQIHDEKGRLVGAALSGTADAVIAPETVIANGILFAAAPELLTALRDLLDQVERQPSEFMVGPAVRAISKAEGRD